MSDGSPASSKKPAKKKKAPGFPDAFGDFRTEKFPPELARSITITACVLLIADDGTGGSAGCSAK